ncbi:flagellar hook-length control protein FliK [Sodalis endosymbiont of Spalangia cameroni]
MMTLPNLTDVAAVHPAGNAGASQQADADSLDFTAVLQGKVSNAAQPQGAAAHAGQDVGQGAGKRPPSVKVNAPEDGLADRDTAATVDNLDDQAISDGHGKKTLTKAAASDTLTITPSSQPLVEPTAVPLNAAVAGDTSPPTVPSADNSDDGLPGLLAQSRNLLIPAGVSGLQQAATLAAGSAVALPSAGQKTASTQADRLSAALPGAAGNADGASATASDDLADGALSTVTGADHDGRADNSSPRPLSTGSDAASATPAAAPSTTDAGALFPASLSGAVAATAATATPPSAMIAAQLGSDEWQQALGQQLVMFARNNQSNAELRLHPADLGSLQISLHIQDNQLQIHMVSDHAQVRDTLQAALPHLRSALAESGIQLGQSSVGGQAYSGGQNRDGTAGGGRQPRAFSAVADSAPQGHTAQGATAISNGRINTYI